MYGNLSKTLVKLPFFLNGTLKKSTNLGGYTKSPTLFMGRYSPNKKRSLHFTRRQFNLNDYVNQTYRPMDLNFNNNPRFIAPIRGTYPDDNFNKFIYFIYEKTGFQDQLVLKRNYSQLHLKKKKKVNYFDLYDDVVGSDKDKENKENEKNNENDNNTKTNTNNNCTKKTFTINKEIDIKDNNNNDLEENKIEILSNKTVVNSLNNKNFEDLIEQLSENKSDLTTKKKEKDKIKNKLNNIEKEKIHKEIEKINENTNYGKFLNRPRFSKEKIPVNISSIMPNLPNINRSIRESDNNFLSISQINLKQKKIGALGKKSESVANIRPDIKYQIEYYCKNQAPLMKNFSSYFKKINNRYQYVDPNKNE